MRQNLTVRALRVSLAILFLAGAACSSNAPTSNFPPCTPHSLTSPGKTIPDCSFEGFNGSPTLKLSSLRGRPTVLNFWASWCIECVGEMPAFQRVFASLGGRVAFVGMNVTGLVGETEGAGRAFAKRTGVRYQLAFDPGGLLYGHFGPAHTASRLLLPITIFVNSKGVVVERNFGALSEKDLRKDIADFFHIT